MSYSSDIHISGSVFISAYQAACTKQCVSSSVCENKIIGIIGKWLGAYRGVHVLDDSGHSTTIYVNKALADSFVQTENQKNHRPKHGEIVKLLVQKMSADSLYMKLKGDQSDVASNVQLEPREQVLLADVINSFLEDVDLSKQDSKPESTISLKQFLENRPILPDITKGEHQLITLLRECNAELKKKPLQTQEEIQKEIQQLSLVPDNTTTSTRKDGTIKHPISNTISETDVEETDSEATENETEYEDDEFFEIEDEKNVNDPQSIIEKKSAVESNSSLTTEKQGDKSLIKNLDVPQNVNESKNEDSDKEIDSEVTEDEDEEFFDIEDNPSPKIPTEKIESNNEEESISNVKIENATVNFNNEIEKQEERLKTDNNSTATPKKSLELPWSTWSSWSTLSDKEIETFKKVQNLNNEQSRPFSSRSSGLFH